MFLPARLIALGTLLLFAPPSALASTLVTFDDLPGTSGEIPNGYAGLNWNGFLYYEPSSAVATLGVVSSPKVAVTVTEEFPGGASFASFKIPTAMDVTGGYFSSNTGDPVDINISGYANGIDLYERHFHLSHPGSAYLEVDFVAVDSVYFNAFSTGAASDNAAFQLDNLSLGKIYPTPILGSLPLFGSGLAMLLAAKRKRTVVNATVRRLQPIVRLSDTRTRR